MAIVKATRDMAEKAISEIDWNAVDATTDEEIARQIAENPDAAPDLTADRVKLIFRFKSDRLPTRHKVRLLRRALGMSQAQFADAYRIPRRTLQNWEQGAREPDETVMTLLKLIAHRPEETRRMLAEID